MVNEDIQIKYDRICQNVTHAMKKIKPGIKERVGGRSQDGGGIGRVITVSSTDSLKEQQNSEQSLQNNF